MVSAAWAVHCMQVWRHVNMVAKIKKKHEFPKLAVDKVEKFVFLRIKPAE